MRTIPAVVVSGLSLVLVLGLTGCKNDRDDDRSYVEIGEARVYENDSPRETSRRPRAIQLNESVPAPAALPEVAAQSAPRSPAHTKPARSRQYVTVGDLEPD